MIWLGNYNYRFPFQSCQKIWCQNEMNWWCIRFTVISIYTESIFNKELTLHETESTLSLSVSSPCVLTRWICVQLQVEEVEEGKSGDGRSRQDGIGIIKSLFSIWLSISNSVNVLSIFVEKNMWRTLIDCVYLIVVLVSGFNFILVSVLHEI